ncbi:hypothetical protein SAY87_023984 [Trapa incisa]|uniref:BHLH domain-containing protein n=1 Tax=Trapa incisa TaxID=236973 RepID=A0AAN7KTH0_9MYRT|nr:hypothetical protein SAY87_023984 [Trapa incisa]
MKEVERQEKSFLKAGRWESSAHMVEWDAGSNSSLSPENLGGGPVEMFPSYFARRKRPRLKVVKKKEEVESQRINHIAVERNRRKQMNQYLSELRSLIPSSYLHRGDQASIIGGAVNFVKDLEQLLQSLKAAQRKNPPHSKTAADGGGNYNLSSSPFADFFTFPQYSTDPSQPTSYVSKPSGPERAASATADVEVTMVDAHANVRVLTRKQPKQLLKMMVGLEYFCLSVLHLSVTAADGMALYSFSLKVEDDCQLRSGNDIASAIYQMVGRIQEEEGLVSANH